MDAEVVSTSLQSLMATNANSSWPSVLNHSSSGTDEDDVFQAVSASQQFYDQQSADLQNYTDFIQSPAGHTQHQSSRTPLGDVRNMSPFGQAFLVPNADSRSPAVMTTTNSSAMTVDDSMAASFSQHISPSPVGSDSHAHFTGFGSNAVSMEHHGSASFTVANSLQSVDVLLHSDGGQSAAVMQPQGVAANLGIQPSAKQEEKTDQKASFPPPPKKPLSPYMRFSKGIWQKVKAENPNSSVCWVGSQIGQIWRELNDGEKQRYVDEFNKDKERYDIEFANYLKLTGLQASDLVKPRTKKKGTKRAAVRTAKQPESQVSPSGVNQQPAVVVQTTAATGQPSEITIMSVGNNGQPDRFLVNRSDGSQMGEMSSLPSISQVWSNSNFVANQELTNQMLIAAGQLAYNQPQLQQLQQLQQQEQQRRSTEANNAAQRISVNGNNQQVATQYSDTGIPVSHQQHTVVQQPTSYANCTTQAMTAGMVSGGQQPDTKCWSWQQVSVIPQSSQGGVQQQQQQSNGATVTYQFPTSAAPSWNSPIGHPQSRPLVANQSTDRSGQLLLQTDVLESQNLQMISAIQGQYNNITGAINENIYRMNQQTASGGREPDQEILKLRAALHEATEQSVHLMKELTVVYAEVHELKQMNDDLREQYRMWEEARMSGSVSADVDAARSGPSAGQSA